MNDLIMKYNELCESNEHFVMATIVEVTGSIPQEVGAKMIVYNNGQILGTIGGGAIEKWVIDEAQSLKESTLKEYILDSQSGQLCGGKTKIFLEVVSSKFDLYIFGAGHVGQALCKVMEDSPFNIHLIDEREEWVNSPNLPSKIITHPISFDAFIKKAKWNLDKTFVVVMTFGHQHDLEILNLILKKDFCYLGLMGSLNKWENFKISLEKSGFRVKDLNKITCPIGDKELGRSPGEIAIGIAWQLLRIKGQIIGHTPSRK